LDRGTDVSQQSTELVHAAEEGVLVSLLPVHQRDGGSSVRDCGLVTRYLIAPGLEDRVASHRADVEAALGATIRVRHLLLLPHWLLALVAEPALSPQLHLTVKRNRANARTLFGSSWTRRPHHDAATVIPTATASGPPRHRLARPPREPAPTPGCRPH